MYGTCNLYDCLFTEIYNERMVLCFIAAKKSLSDLRQLYFRLKDEVFANPRGGFAYNTKALQKILQEILGTEKCMCDVTQPK